MAIANVSISFECESQEDARTKLDKWKLHEGCKVFMNVTETGVPRETTSAGKIIEATPPPPPEPPVING